MRYANFTITNQVKNYLEKKIRLGKRFIECSWINQMNCITKIVHEDESIVEATSLKVKIGNRKTKVFKTKNEFGKIKNHLMIENPIFSLKFFRNNQPAFNQKLIQRLAEATESNFNLI